jgi:hypothetical protein
MSNDKINKFNLIKNKIHFKEAKFNKNREKNTEATLVILNRKINPIEKE